MVSTAINYALPAKQQFFAMLNKMSTEVLSESDVTLSAPYANVEAAGYNSHIDVAINRMVIRNPKQLNYNRVSVAEVFAEQTVISVRELDMGFTGLLPDHAQFIPQVLVKYGFKIHAEDFTVAKSGEYLVNVSAIDDNLGYTGAIAVVIEKSLKTRCPNVILNGFADSQLVLS